MNRTSVQHSASGKQEGAMVQLENRNEVVIGFTVYQTLYRIAPRSIWLNSACIT